MNKIKNVENYLKNLLFSGEITIEELENLSVRLRDELKQPKKKTLLLFLKWRLAGMRLPAESFRRIQMPTRTARVWSAGLIRTRMLQKGNEG